MELTNSVFEQSWYMDAVCPNGYKEIVDQKGETICARLPVYEYHTMGRSYITNPPMTQTCGVAFNDFGGKLTKKLERQKQSIEHIVEQIPKSADVRLFLDHQNTYVLPWIWHGFQVKPRFSYRIEQLDDLDSVWDNLRENIRREIRKAEKKVTIRAEREIDVILDMEQKTFRRQGRNSPTNAVDLARLDKILAQHHARKIMYAEDELGQIHAAAYLIYDERCCYYMIGGGDPELRNSGAASLLLWECIRFASTVSKTFDFEGSMIEEIERFFRAFGGVPTVYYEVSRLHALRSMQEWLKPRIKKLVGYR